MGWTLSKEYRTMTRDQMRRALAPKLARALDRAAYWKAVWDGFWWITIGAAALALVLAILVTPECLGC